MKKPYYGLMIILPCLVLTACLATGIQGAAQRGDLANLQAMMGNDGSQIDKQYQNGQTLLHSAAEYGKLDVVRYLVENGADISKRADGYYGYQTIHFAVLSGNLEMVKYLVSKGADVNALADGKVSVLHLAVQNYNVNSSMIKYLISSGSNVNAKDEWGVSVLQSAASTGNVNLVKYLVSSGADIGAVNNEGQTAAAYIQGWMKDSPELNKVYSYLTSVAWKENDSAKNNVRPLNAIHFGDTNLNSNRKTTIANPKYFGSAQSNDHAKKYYAVVIGNNNYASFSPLNTAVRDAQTVAHLLKTDYYFECITIINGSRMEILQTFDWLRSKLTSSSDLLIYYAGHGYFDRKADRGYWLPVDAQRDTTANWISNADITDRLKAIEANHIMIVADSCYSGTLTRGIKVSLRSPDYFQKISSLRSRTVLTSGGLEPVADSEGGEHSVFAQAFINALKSNRSTIDGTELFAQIRRPVVLNSDQTPEYSDIRKAGHEGGDFFFTKR